MYTPPKHIATLLLRSRAKKKPQPSLSWLYIYHNSCENIDQMRETIYV